MSQRIYKQIYWIAVWMGLLPTAQLYAATCSGQFPPPSPPPRVFKNSDSLLFIQPEKLTREQWLKKFRIFKTVLRTLWDSIPEQKRTTFTQTGNLEEAFHNFLQIVHTISLKTSAGNSQQLNILQDCIKEMLMLGADPNAIASNGGSIAFLLWELDPTIIPLLRNAATERKLRSLELEDVAETATPPPPRFIVNTETALYSLLALLFAMAALYPSLLL